MKKIILVDGNNLLFRSYYATAYNGNFMKNSKGFPTNALFGFHNMLTKIIADEKPEYMIVAFDKGKTFRHEEYKDYKGGRIQTPDELKQQFPVAKELVTLMGYTYYEIDNYEADDIIGTFAAYCDEDDEIIGTIVSSDKDLLQLISDDVDMKLLKQKDYIRYNKETFFEDYGIMPERVVDLKALEGDPSDNIPGVKGIGEKTALKLLRKYGTLDGIYEHIDEIKGSVHDKLLLDKENAYQSYHLATIVKDVDMDISIEDVKCRERDHEKLEKLYEELEFYSFLKKEKEYQKKEPEEVEHVPIVNSIDEIKVEGKCSVYLELLGTNYHHSDILGMAVYDGKNLQFIPKDILVQAPKFLFENEKYTYDAKKVYVALKWIGIDVENITFDSMIAASLLDYNVKEDISYLANNFDYHIPFYETVYGKKKLKAPKMEEVALYAGQKAKFIYETKEILENKLKEEELLKLYKDIEFPLAFVLGDMEFNGVYLDQDTLKEMGKEIEQNVSRLEQEIYKLAGCEFLITSPKELGNILFERLGLPHGKKGARGYSTAADVLEKLKDVHPIINKILEYRMITKLYTTYIEGLLNMVKEDGKIHTIYTQTLTRTGRLSSIEPNLQNIPVRTEYGRLIRKAFVPSEHCVILGGDYSQIELRILAHMSGVQALIDAFNQGMDIHTKTASDIFHVAPEEVTKQMRRVAKAVNFGIIYGISSFGLSENLNISVGEAKHFIDHYLETYPGIQEYMDKQIKQAYQDGYVKTLFHRKRIITELNNSNYMIRHQGERMALNTPIQGTSADIIKKAMVDIGKELKKRKLKTKMILQVHDELLFDCDKDEIEIIKDIIRDKMEHVLKLKVPLKVDIAYGNNWYEAK